MTTNRTHIAGFLFLTVLCALSGGMRQVSAAEGQDRPKSEMPRPQGDDANLPNGVRCMSGRIVLAIRPRCTWPMCIRRALHGKQASSTEMKW